MKRRDSLVLLVVIILVTVGITSVVYSKSRVIRVQDFLVVASVSDQPGLGFNGTQITLGQVQPGGKSSKTLNATNKFPFEVEIYFQVFGNITRYFEIIPKLTIPANSTKGVSVIFRPDRDAKYGKYTGTLRAIYKRK